MYNAAFGPKCQRCGMQVSIKDISEGSSIHKHKSVRECDNTLASTITDMVDAVMALQDKRKSLVVVG